MKPIETQYADTLFRSRLEARWAVFLDALGIRWEYEPEAYAIGDGEAYLPDFRLPTFDSFDGDLYVEVKPEGAGRVEFDKALRFCSLHGVAVWLCDGVPDFKVTHLISSDPYLDPSLKSCSVEEIWKYRIPVIPLADQAEREDRFYVSPGYENGAGYFDRCYAGKTYEQAISRVRGHRFWEPTRGSK